MNCFKAALLLALWLALPVTPVVADDAGSERPTLELLEFLGELAVKEDGEWLDPVEIEGLDIPEQEHENNDTAEK